MDRLDATRGRSPVPAPPRGFAAQGFRRPGVSPPPGFRPGLWSTGPTARPGTGERPVGAPDHSQGRNPWAVKPQGETLGGTDTANAAKPRAACANPTANAERLAPLAQTLRQTPRDLRRLRKRHGKRRETCGTPANATANAERLAGTPANATANAERLAGTPANILST